MYSIECIEYDVHNNIHKFIINYKVIYPMGYITLCPIQFFLVIDIKYVRQLFIMLKIRRI